MITASRLATEKHISWLSGSDRQAHDGLTLDIYGKG